MTNRSIIKGLKALHLNKKAATLAGMIYTSESSVDFETARKNILAISPKPRGKCLHTNEIEKRQYDVKIIVPAYNAEKYLSQCLESVLSQKTQFSYCIHIINDGSTDSTEKILSKYSMSSNIIIENCNNHGAAASRNRALQSLDSKYIMFLDADDLLCPEAIQRLIAHAEKNNLDIVEGSYNVLFDGQVTRTVKTKELSCGVPLGVLNGYPWGKVFKASLFKQVVFPEGFWFEDTIVSMLLYRMTDRAGTIDSTVYEYRINNQGATAIAAKSQKCIDSYWIMEQCIEDANCLDLQGSLEYYKQLLRQMAITEIRARNMPKTISESLFVLGRKLFQEEVNAEVVLNDYWLDLLKNAITNNNYNWFKIICEVAEF